MKVESEMMLERVGRSCRVPREELCCKVRGKKFLWRTKRTLATLFFGTT
jgi:hypothetical protein